MLDLIFDVNHEWYCLYFRPSALSFKQFIIMQLKIFVNILALAVLFTLPIAVLMIGAMYLDGNL